MLIMVAIASFCTCFEFISVLHSMSPKYMKRALGYKWLIDLVCSLGMTIYFGLSGAISAMIIAAVSGFFFCLALHATASIIGYSRYEKVDGKRQWVDYPPTWTAASMGGAITKGFRWLANAVKSVFAGAKQEANVQGA